MSLLNGVLDAAGALAPGLPDASALLASLPWPLISAPSPTSSRHHLRVPKPCNGRTRSRGSLLMTVGYLYWSGNAACIGKRQARIARVHAFRIAVAKVAEKVGFHTGSRKEELVYRGIVETGQIG